MYYCNSSSLSQEFDHVDHFSHLLRKIKPESDTVAYLDLVNDDSEALFGAYGRYLTTQNTDTNLCTDNRKELESRFRKGEIAYKETPLGVCLTMSPCVYGLLIFCNLFL